MADRTMGAAAVGDAISDDDEIPDYVLAYLQTEEGRTGENIPDHVMEYIQKQAMRLGRQEQPSVSGRVSDTKPDIHIDANSVAENRTAHSDDCAAGRPDDEMEVSAADESVSAEMATAPAAEECAGLCEARNDIDESVTATTANEFQTVSDTVRPESEGATVAAAAGESVAGAKKSKRRNRFDLRSISLPHLPEMPSMAGIKLPKFLQSSKERTASQKSVGDQKENAESAGAPGAKAKRRFRSVSFRQKMRDEIDQSGSGEVGPGKKFSLSSLSLRRWSHDKEKVRDESVSPIRQKIREHLDAWNTREVVETKFNLSDFKIRGRNREKHPKGRDVKRTESMSPIRKKIQQEWEAWNTREVVETKFNASDFKIRGRTREKEGKEKDVKRTESMSPLRQKIQKEWDAWNTRTVVETKFNLSDFKRRNRSRDKGDKTPEVKRMESLSPIRKLLRDEWEAWNTRQVVETKFSMKDFKPAGRRKSRDPEGGASTRSRSKESSRKVETAPQTSEEPVASCEPETVQTYSHQVRLGNKETEGVNSEQEQEAVITDEPTDIVDQVVDEQIESEPLNQKVGESPMLVEPSADQEESEEESEVETETTSDVTVKNAQPEAEPVSEEVVEHPAQAESSADEEETEEESEVETETTSKPNGQNAEPEAEPVNEAVVEQPMQVDSSADEEETEESEVETEMPGETNAKDAEVGAEVVQQVDKDMQSEEESESEVEQCARKEEDQVADVIVHQSSCEPAAANESMSEEEEEEEEEEIGEVEEPNEVVECEIEESIGQVPSVQAGGSVGFDDIVVDPSETKVGRDEDERVGKATLASRSRHALQATKAKIQTTLSKDNLQATRNKLVTKTEATRQNLATKTAAARHKLATKTEETRQKLALKTEETRQKLATTTEATRQRLQTSTKQLQAAGQKLQTKLSAVTLVKKKKSDLSASVDAPVGDDPNVSPEKVDDIGANGAEEPITDIRLDIETSTADVDTEELDKCADIPAHEDGPDAQVVEVENEELESEGKGTTSRADGSAWNAGDENSVEETEEVCADEEEAETVSVVEIHRPASAEDFPDRQVIDGATQSAEPENFDEITIDQMTIHGDESEALISTDSTGAKRKTLADRSRKVLQVTKSKIQTTLSKDNLQATRHKLQTTRHRLQSTLSTKTLATRQKLQSTLSKQNLQATGQKLQSKLSDTLIKRRRKKSKNFFTDRPAGDSGDQSVFQIDLTEAAREPDDMSTPNGLSVPRRARRKKATESKPESPKITYPTAKRRLKRKAKASAQLTYSRLLCDEIDVHEGSDEAEDELEPKLEFHLHETHHERPPSVSQSTNTIPEDGFESDKENGFRSRSRASKTSFSDPWKGYPPYENVMYDPPPRRLKRLEKAPDSAPPDWHQTWPRKDIAAEVPAAPKRVKRAVSNAGDFTTWPRTTRQPPQRSRSEMTEEAVRDIEKQIVQPIPAQIPGESEIVDEPVVRSSCAVPDMTFEPIYRIVKTDPVWQLAKRVPFAPVRLRKRSSSRLSVSTDLGSELLTGTKSGGRTSESMEWMTHVDDDLDDPNYAEIKDFQVKTPSPTQPPLPAVSPPSADLYTIPRRKPRLHMSISPSPERPSGSYCTVRPHRAERRSRPSSTDYSQWDAAVVKEDPRRARTVSVPPRIRSRCSSVSANGQSSREAARQAEVAKPVASAPQVAPPPTPTAREEPKSEGVSIAIQTEPMMDYHAVVQRPDIKAIIASSQLGAYEYRKLQQEIALEIKLRKELEELDDYAKQDLEELPEMNDLNGGWQRKTKDSGCIDRKVLDDKQEEPEELEELLDEDLPAEDEADPYDYDTHKDEEDVEYLDGDYKKGEEEYLDDDVQKDVDYLEDDYRKGDEEIEYIDDEYQKEEYADEDDLKAEEEEEEYFDEEAAEEEEYDGGRDGERSPARSEEYESRSGGKRYDPDYGQSDISQSEEDLGRYDRDGYRSDENNSRSEEDVGRYDKDFCPSEATASRSEADVGQLEDDLYRFEQQVGLLEKDLNKFEEDLYRSEDELDVSQCDNEPKKVERRGGPSKAQRDSRVTSVDAEPKQVSKLMHSPKDKSPAYADQVPVAVSRPSRRDWNETWPRTETSLEEPAARRNLSPSTAQVNGRAAWRSPARSPVPPPSAPERSRSRSRVAEVAPSPTPLPVCKPERPSLSPFNGLEAETVDRPVGPNRVPFAPQRSRSKSQNYDSIVKDPEEPMVRKQQPQLQQQQKQPQAPQRPKEKSPEPELAYGREHYAPRRSQTRSVERTLPRVEESKPRGTEVQRSVPRIPSPKPPTPDDESSPQPQPQLSPRPKGVERPRSPWPLGVTPSNSPTGTRTEPSTQGQLSRGDSEMEPELEVESAELEIDSRSLPKPLRVHKREPFNKEDFRRKLAELPAAAASAAASLIPKMEMPSLPNPMTVMRKREVPKKDEVRRRTEKDPSPVPLTLPMPTQTISVLREQPAPKPPLLAEPVKSQVPEHKTTAAACPAPEPAKAVPQPSPTAPLRKPPAMKTEYSWRKTAESRAKAAAEATAKPPEPEAPTRAKTEPLQPAPTPAPAEKDLPLRRKKLEPAAQSVTKVPEVIVTPSAPSPAVPAPPDRRSEVPTKKESDEVVKKPDVHKIMKGCSCPSCRPVTDQAPPQAINEDPDFCYLLVKQALAKAASAKAAGAAESACNAEDAKPEIEIIEINGSSSLDSRTMKLTITLLILLMVMAAVFLFYTQKLANDWERLD